MPCPCLMNWLDWDVVLMHSAGAPVLDRDIPNTTHNPLLQTSFQLLTQELKFQMGLAWWVTPPQIDTPLNGGDRWGAQRSLSSQSKVSHLFLLGNWHRLLYFVAMVDHHSSLTTSLFYLPRSYAGTHLELGLTGWTVRCEICVLLKDIGNEFILRSWATSWLPA